MIGGTTQVGIREGVMQGEVFLTPSHPPRIILMGGNSEGSLGMTDDVDFPRVQHPGAR